MLLAGVWRFGWSLEALPPPEVLVVLTGFDGLLLLSWPLQWEASALSSGEERKKERKKERRQKKKKAWKSLEPETRLKSPIDISPAH